MENKKEYVGGYQVINHSECNALVMVDGVLIKPPPLTDKQKEMFDSMDVYDDLVESGRNALKMKLLASQNLNKDYFPEALAVVTTTEL